MAALVAGVLAGSIMAAVGGYALYKLLDCIRGKKVAPCSPPESRLLTVERGNRELETQCESRKNSRGRERSRKVEFP